jgi:hypothetical protein
MYKIHVISTCNELLTSGFCPPNRPDHYGVDLVDAQSMQNTPKGVDITAFAGGKVVEVIKGSLVGNTVAISHAGKILTRYQHMRDGVAVKSGDIVQKGQKLGVMGNTGYCVSSNTSVPAEYRGTHLHFAVKENSTAYDNGTWVNPEPYLNGVKVIADEAVPTVSAASKPAQTAAQNTADSVSVSALKTGDKVKVLSAINYDTGKPFVLYYSVYDVMQVKGDRVVVGINGAATAAVSIKNLAKA